MMGETYVDQISNAVLLFSNPVWSGADSIPSTVIRNITALSSNIAYSADITQNITVLSSKYAQTDNGVIQGLLYVPDLAYGNPCVAAESQYVPSTAVRQNQLPPSDYNLIALIPWFNPNCTKSYLAAAAADPIRALIAYVPDNTSDKPPGPDHSIWYLQDKGAWKTSSKFPIYAVPGTVGAEMMNQASLYSGNVAEVPFGENITALYSPDADDYVRIWSEIHVTTPNSLPTIWTFILVCVGVLLFVVVSISFLMHYIQRRRRASLQRRVISGEVNLEAMNIKRLRVPVEHVEKFPIFTYNYEPDLNSYPPSPTSLQSPSRARTRTNSLGIADVMGLPSSLVEKDYPQSPGARSTITAITAITSTTQTDYQPTCAICLKDYQNRVTIIRELSCGHIFHPECIDEYLTQNSSLCPQCKTSMLPPGYCPKITNTMVRKERGVRRLRDRVTVEESDVESAHRVETTAGWKKTVKKKLFRPSVNPSNAVPVQQLPARHQSPSEETRLRMRNLAGAEFDTQSWDGHPRWKRAIRTVFPGFR